MAQPSAVSDRDLASMHEARTLARRAREAAPALAELSQAQIDAIVDAMAAAATPQAEALARLACEETGFGVVADKIQKNLFASEKIYRFIRPMKTVGVVNRIEDRCSLARSFASGAVGDKFRRRHFARTLAQSSRRG